MLWNFELDEVCETKKLNFEFDKVNFELDKSNFEPD